MQIVFKWQEEQFEDDGGTYTDSVLMAGSFVIGSYRNEGLPTPKCRLPGATVDGLDCYTQPEAKARVEAAVERWFVEVMPNG